MPEPRKILLIDDSAAFRNLLKSGLARLAKFSFEEAADGKQALALSDKQKFDLILCDINMPVMGGFTFLAELRRRPLHKDTPVVVVSGVDDEGDRQRAEESGAVAYLIKPVQMPTFLELVNRVLK
jgi:two-component system chemotaxis response regulator CheY